MCAQKLTDASLIYNDCSVLRCIYRACTAVVHNDTHTNVSCSGIYAIVN